MSLAKLCPESDTNQDINLNNDQYFANSESNYDDKKLNKPINLTINKLVDCNKIIDDIWPTIFRELSIQDLLNCRLVNKKFKYFSDHTKGINKLIIGWPNYDDHDNYWYYNNELLDDKDIISLKCFRTIQKLSIFNLDKYLKYLKIYDSQFKLEEISNLINLESIEFGYYYLINKKQQILNLNNLKVFASNNCVIQLNTPKLMKIKCMNMNAIKSISKPETVKHLITRNYGNKLEIFKNLEIIELRGTDQLVINKNLFSFFKNLKQLKINLNFNYDHVNYSNELIKNSLIKILNDKIKSKRSIDIYLEGIKIENIDKFNELVSDSIWKFRLNNYDLLDLNLPSIKNLPYDEIESCVNNIKNDLPSSFFNKFIHINFVRVDSVKDIDGLNWFLNNLKCLNKLYFGSRVSLDEVFYNNLPNTIRSLQINNSKDINYDFILKLSKLNCLNTHVSKDLFDLALESFLNLKYLKKFIFYYNYNQIIIEKKGQYFYLPDDRTSDYNDLKEEFNIIRSNFDQDE